MDIKHTLWVLGLLQLGVMIKAIFENRKARRQWELKRRNDFIQLMNAQFAHLLADGSSTENNVGTVIFQFWEGKDLVTSFIFPNGTYSRSIMPSSFYIWPVNDSLLVPQALMLRDKLLAMTNLSAPMATAAIPEDGYMVIHLLTADGWQTTGFQQSEAILQSAWSAILAMDMQANAIYQLVSYGR